MIKMKINLRLRIYMVVSITLLTALLTWLGMLAISSQAYVFSLTHPACAHQAAPPEGYQAIQLTLPDQVKLDGYWRAPQTLPREDAAPQGSVIVLLGGNGDSRDGMIPTANLLALHGFGVITLDYRSCVGAPSTLGYKEIEELNAAVTYARAQPGVKHVGVLGFSVGGVTAIRGAARSLSIETVIAMGGFSNLEDHINVTPSPLLSTRWIVKRMVLYFFAQETGVEPRQVSPISDVGAISPRPVLLIYGDKEIESAKVRQLFAAAREPKALWIVPGADHGEYQKLYPKEFEDKVVHFFIQAFKNAAP